MRIKPVCSDKFIGFHGVGDEYATNQRVRSKVRVFLGTSFELPLPEIPSSSHPLYGSILKLHVANSDIDELDRDIQGLVDPKLNRIVFEDEPETEYKLARLIVKRPSDPTWNTKVGHIAHDLRSALDIAVTQLSRRRKGRLKKPSFPIFIRGSSRLPNIKDFERHGVRLIKHLRLEYQAIVKGAQPYHAGNLRWRHPLWLLHELNREDKHNIVTLASGSIGGAAYFFPIPAAYADVGTFHVGVPFEDRAVLARLRREVQVKPHYSAAVRFANGCRAVAGEEVIDTLRAIEKEVRKIISAFVSAHSAPPSKRV